VGCVVNDVWIQGWWSMILLSSMQLAIMPCKSLSSAWKQWYCMPTVIT
jgi:hypothetical protein